jgi:hypothetical protein
MCFRLHVYYTRLTFLRSGVNQQTATSASTATFVTALVFNAAVFGIEIGLFTILRPYFKQIYERRTLVPVEKYDFIWRFILDCSRSVHLGTVSNLSKPDF